ncbi:MAG: ABC transporter ATP-binding protein [Dehalococcoidia bacterium]
MSTSGPLVDIRDLHLQFNTFDGVSKVLAGVNLQLQRGDIMGLVGETGCGKTMTALSIPRLIPCPPGEIVKGEVLLAGEDVLQKSEAEMREIRARRIGMIFQDPTTNLSPVFTIEQQMVDAVLCRLGQGSSVSINPFRGWIHSDKERRQQARKTAISLLRRVGIHDAERRITSYPHEFSGGMRQRVLIAMNLAGSPDLLIADEPTTALDVSIQAQILSLIRDLVREFNLTVLMITHNLGVVAQVCNRVAVMYAGRVVETGDLRRVFKAPAHPYTASLLRAIPTRESAGRTLADIPGSIPNLLSPPLGCRFNPRCPHVMPVCQAEPPPGMTFLESGHEVACHLYDGGGRPVLVASGGQVQIDA